MSRQEWGTVTITGSCGISRESRRSGLKTDSVRSDLTSAIQQRVVLNSRTLDPYVGISLSIPVTGADSAATEHH